MVRQVSSGPYSITTAPSLTICRKIVNRRTGDMCKRPVLAATISGFDTHVDTATLNDSGELAALLEGRRTYALVAQDYLARRTALNIAAGPPKKPVLAEHACRAVPDHHIDPAWTLAARALIYSALGVEEPVDNDTETPPPF